MHKNQFTNDQEIVLNLNEGNHLVLAPPGAGKTELLAERLNLAIQNGLPAEDMLCITFTNRAAKNMLDRIGSKNKNIPFVGTLHNFGIKFLLKNKIIPTNTTLLDEDDTKQLIQDAISELKETDNNLKSFEINLTKLSTFIRENLFQKLDISSDIFDPNNDISNQLKLSTVNPLSEIEHNYFIKISDKYAEIKKSSCCIDFDDILFLTLKTLVQDENLVMSNYRWIQIDEVQDLSSLQWSILNKLKSKNCHSVYFGDHDQAIFSFMGASQASLEKFTQNCEKHYLTENFRSPQKLIDLFNTYAQKNFPKGKVQNQIIKKSGSQDNQGKFRKILISGTFDDEAEEISRKIVPEQLDNHKKIALLSRTNNEAELLSAYLENRKIAHFRVSGFDLFHRRTIKDALALIRSIRRPDDRLAWSRLVSIFGKIPSLRASRELVNGLQKNGIYPQDYLNSESKATYLDTFISNFEGKRIVVFDTETSGLDTKNDDIIQIAAVEIIEGIPTGKEFEVYIQTEKDLTESSKIHNISNSYLKTHGVEPEIGLNKFKKFVDGAVLVGHNISKFDLKILDSNLKKYSIELFDVETSYDTLSLTKRIYPTLTNYTLSALINSFELSGKNSHNALDDVRANVNLLLHLHSKVKFNTANRNKIHTDSKKYLDQFKLNFSPFWEKTLLSLNENLNLGDLITDFFMYSTERVGYRCNDEDVKYNAKLINYLKNEWPKNNQFSTLYDTIYSKLAVELSTYSESDLITDNDRLVVSTIHKAKGLEFDSVVVTGCVKDNFPHFYSRNNQSATAEDARLLYVALTRAKAEILITMHDSVTNRGGTFPRYPSPFLNFID